METDLKRLQQHLLTLEDLAKVLVNTGQVMVSQIRMVQRVVEQGLPDEPDGD